MLISMEASPLMAIFQVYSKKAMNAIKIYNAHLEHHRSPGMLRITGISPIMGGFRAIRAGLGWLWGISPI